jgi:hypothetical protein
LVRFFLAAGQIHFGAAQGELVDQRPEERIQSSAAASWWSIHAPPEGRVQVEEKPPAGPMFPRPKKKSKKKQKFPTAVLDRFVSCWGQCCQWKAANKCSATGLPRVARHHPAEHICLFSLFLLAWPFLLSTGGHHFDFSTSGGCISAANEKRGADECFFIICASRIIPLSRHWRTPSFLSASAE